MKWEIKNAKFDGTTILRSVILIPVLDLPQEGFATGRCTRVLSPVQITLLLTLPHPSAFRVAQLTHVRRHARSKGTGHDDKSPTQTPGRFKNIRARRRCTMRFCDGHPCGAYILHVYVYNTFGVSRQTNCSTGQIKSLIEIINFCPATICHPILIGAMMKEITGDEFCYINDSIS